MINGDIGFSMHSGGKLNLGLLSKGNFSKKQEARAMKHVSVKPNERRKKLSLLQMQRGKVIKYMQIWQGSQKCKEVHFVLILFSFYVNSLSFCSLPCMLVHANMQFVSLFPCWFQPAQTSQPTVFFSQKNQHQSAQTSTSTNQRTCPGYY